MSRHAVRWISRIVLGEENRTKWHVTDDAKWTLCKLTIPLLAGNMPPETHEDTGVVDCVRCLKGLREGRIP
jgi:hypothetical protein